MPLIPVLTRTPRGRQPTVEVEPDLLTVEVEPAVEVEPTVEVEPAVEFEPTVEVAPAVEVEPTVEVEPDLLTDDRLRSRIAGLARRFVNWTAT